MEQIIYQMGQEKGVLTPEIKDILAKLDRLVKDQDNKLPSFNDDDKKKLTSEVVEKIKLG